MADLPERIADLEAEILTLAEAAQRCRKISFLAKGLIAVGGLLLTLIVLGVFRSGATALVIALAAGLGGIALLGSNQRSWDETLASLKAREAQRTALIDQLRLWTVAGG
jgi:hypothetical protein